MHGIGSMMTVPARFAGDRPGVLVHDALPPAAPSPQRRPDVMYLNHRRPLFPGERRV